MPSSRTDFLTGGNSCSNWPRSGQSSASIAILHQALQSAPILVIDADALNLMAQHPKLSALCERRRPSSTLLTPHPLEAARLLNCSLTEVQQDRIAAAKNLAQKFDAHIILKGSGSILAHFEGPIALIPPVTLHLPPRALVMY